MTRGKLLPHFGHNLARLFKTFYWDNKKHVENTDEVIERYTNMFLAVKGDKLKASCNGA
jgi:hypothetical protein